MGGGNAPHVLWEKEMGYFGLGGSGSERKTADGAVGPSGTPIRVYSGTILSGATAGKLILKNGTGIADDAYTYQIGVANGSVTVNFEGGLRFPDGCYYDHDSNASASIIEFSVEK